MKFKKLDGTEISCSISTGKHPMRPIEECKSNAQFYLGQKLRSIYGTHTPILEEWGIPGTRLAIDFYLPTYKLAFEFNGSQHDSYNSFFHHSKQDFLRQKVRDLRKKEWCELNDIRLIIIREDLSVEELKERIYNEEDSV
jgi:hypothetical protein